MAVTGDIFKSLTFDGESSRDYGVYITGQAVYNAPERDVEMVTIPGRNGAFALDKGRFENIEVTYPAGVFANTDTEFAKAISDFRNMLCSRQGYCRLTDEYNPDEYRLAVYKSGLEVDPVQLKAGQFDITFECKPQRYLMSGQQKFIVGNWGETKVKTGDVITFDNTSGIMAVKSADVTLTPHQDLNGYDKPWAGGNGKNKLPNNTGTTTLNGVSFIKQPDGSVLVNGTASAEVSYDYYRNLTKLPTGIEAGGSYILSNNIAPTPCSIEVYCSTNGTSFQYVTGLNMAASVNFTVPTGAVGLLIRIKIPQGNAANNMTFKAVIRKSTEVDATYEPYTNICPITGASDVDVNVSGKNWLDTEGRTISTTISPTTIVTESCTAVKNGATITATITGAWAKLKYGMSGLRENHTYTLSALFSNPNGAPVGVGYNDGSWHTSEIVTTASVRSSITFTYTSAITMLALLVNNKASSSGEVVTVSEIQLEEGSSATDYVPYNSDSDTYTTSLGTTVYGGSVDVVAGTGAVTYGSVTFDGSSDEAWAQNGSAGVYIPKSSLPNVYTHYYNITIICDQYTQVGAGQATTTNGTFNWNSALNALQFRNENALTVAAFKTALSANPITLVYELATPSSISFTGSQVDTIQGVNYVWSPQGTVTIEYGTGPDFIVNPTLFGCGPLIETRGYGNISFNGHTISLANGAIGTVNLWSRTSGGSLNGSITKTFATGQFNPTDTFSFRVTHMFTLYEDTPSITNTNANATNGYSDNNDGSVTYTIQVPCTFTINTTGQITNKSTYTFGLKKVIANMTVSYNSTTGTVVYSVTTDTVNNPEFALSPIGFTLWECNAVSTLDRLGNPTYIDCDLGEAYKINGGDVVSLNSFVDLGSNLPELAPGANLFSVDNTFSEVAVVPRWWTI